MKAAARTEATSAPTKTEPNPAWVAFFEEALRLAALIRSRRIAREGCTEATQEAGEESEAAAT